LLENVICGKIYKTNVKKRDKMKKIAISLFIILIILFAANVYAEEDFNVLIEAEQETIDLTNTSEVNIQLKLDKYSGDGILGYETILSYDEDIFESIVVAGLNAWEKPTFDNISKKLTSSTTSAEQGKYISQLVFKLKSGITASSTEIYLNNLIISDGNKEVVLNKSITINFKNSNNNNNVVDKTNEININTGNNGTTTNNGGTNNSGTNNGTETNNNNPEEQKTNVLEPDVVITIEGTTDTDNTKATTKIPQTGVGVEMIVGIIIIAILGTLAYIRYRSIKLK